MGDPYSRLEYRRLIAWPQRIEREWPFLEPVLAAAPGSTVLDLGCGTGEHSRFLAERGFEVTGLDRSPAMLEQALEEPLPGNLRFVEGDLRSVDEAIDGPVAAAICLGNVLPHLTEPTDLDSFLASLRRRLLPGGRLVLQLLNYDRIRARGERYLPLSFRDEEAGEIVFLRLMDAREDGTVSFFPSTLRWRPDEEPPLEVAAAKRVELRGWGSLELRAALAENGYPETELYGSFASEPFEPTESRDLIAVAG